MKKVLGLEMESMKLEEEVVFWRLSNELNGRIGLD